MAKKRNVSKNRRVSSKKPARDEQGNPTNTKEVYQDAHSRARALAKGSSIFYPSTLQPAKVRNLPGYVQAVMQAEKDVKAASPEKTGPAPKNPRVPKNPSPHTQNRASLYARLTGGGSAPGRGMGQGSRGGGGFLGRTK